MSRVVFLVALTLVGCDRVFDVTAVPDIDAAIASDGMPPGLCPASYTKTSTGTYRFEPMARTWYEAQLACIADGDATGANTHLAVLDVAEVGVAYSFIQAQMNGFAWIGLTDIVSAPPACGGNAGGFYQWVTDEPVPVSAEGAPPWYPGEPLQPCDSQCVRMLMNQAQIDDANCGGATPYLCECDAYPANPMKY